MSFLKKNFNYNEMSFERDFNLLYVEVNPTIRTGITENEKTEALELWISSKLGTNKKMVKKFTTKTAWEFDVFNQKCKKY